MNSKNANIQQNYRLIMTMDNQKPIDLLKMFKLSNRRTYVFKLLNVVNVGCMYPALKLYRRRESNCSHLQHFPQFMFSRVDIELIGSLYPDLIVIC